MSPLTARPSTAANWFTGKNKRAGGGRREGRGERAIKSDGLNCLLTNFERNETPGQAFVINKQRWSGGEK